MILIITEKDTAAKKIANILGGGKVKAESYYKVPLYAFANGLEGGEQFTCIGLKGHIMQVEYPPEYSDWRKVEPKELIDADLVKAPSAKAVIRALKKAAKDAERVIIATDYDREGELIGLEALEQAVEANPVLSQQVRRARYSALTKDEINAAFSQPEELAVPLAKAGEARQDIDLIWGATLTRFISLATSRLGNQFLSVGRVQSPTLALIVERELERRAFVPEPYWQVFAELDSSEGQFAARHKTERFQDKSAAEAALKNANTDSGIGTVTAVKSTQKQIKPPAPFNTTAYTKAATALGYSAARAIRLAEDLYLAGYISYPRTDNTVYPQSLDLREILQELSASGALKDTASALLERAELTPTRGKKQTTDHPPIYPAGVPPPGELNEAQMKIWLLVARRFLATLSDEATQESNRVDLDIGGESFVVSGTRIVNEGWLGVYPYSRSRDDEVPHLKEGDEVRVLGTLLEEKETQPPGRYGQGKLVELMEQNGLGTKATRHSIIQNLYDRGYIKNSPPEPTETGIAMIRALDTYASRITKPEMTAELEEEMSAIAEQEMTKEEVVERSRELLRSAYASLEENKEAMAGEIVKGIQEDKLVGPCPNCGQQLRVIRSKKTKKRFIGCEGYPECSTTYPLPQMGNVMSMGKLCPECNTPKVRILTKGRRPWELCLDPDCPTKAEYNKNKARKKKEAS